ncbi:hypothetical protein IAT38_003351 [Cryptococcus sp. DSM 104549]
MSMHFAPQWAKPIKPSGTSLTPTSETPNSGPRKTTLANSPFPALSHAQARASSPTTSTHPPLSYSRVTHTPLSPGVPGDGSYFPNQDANGGEPNAHPFRYSREQILALFDEAKFKERPIELVDVADGPAVLVSKSVNRPVGFRELTDVEKKLLATSVHPAAPARRTAGHTAGAPSADHTSTNGLPTRRAAGFGRGEGGAFGGGGGLGGGKIGTIGGGMLSPGGLDHKAPGALGGGFGGVAKRMARPRGEGGETNGDSTRPAVPNWRPNNRTGSGNFEGVLGFGSGPASAAALPLSPTTDTHDDGFKTAKLGGEPKAVDGEEKKEEGGRFGKGGGPGWGTGQKKWRIAAGLSAPGENDKTIEMPVSNNEHATASVIATPSATPIPERDASVLEPTPAPGRPQEEIQQPQEEKEDLGAVEWFYRDPNGQEQGPFTGTQMHDWYSHSYFTDDLPLRRSNETTFRPLAELKAATGNAVQPFLTPIRPRQLPPNLLIPMAALQPQGLNGLPDAFRGLAVQSPMGAVSPQPIQSSAPQAYTPGYDAFSPGYIQPPQSLDQAVSPGGFGPSPGQGWAQHPQALGRLNMNGMNTAYGSIGLPSPIGAAPLQYMQQQQPQQQQYFSPQQQMGMGGRSAPGDMYSPSVNAGIPVSPWGVPQQVQVPQQQQPQQQAYQQQMQMSPVYQQPQPQPMQMPMPAWTEQPQQQVQQQQQQQPQQVEVTPTQAPVEQLPEEPQEVAQEQAQVPEPEVNEGGDAEEDDMDAVEADITPPAESPVATSAKPSPAAPAPASVWGKTATPAKPPSRKPSLASPPASAQLPAMPSTASKLPPPPSSLPAKPVGGRNAAAATSPKAETTTPQLPKVVAVATPGPTASPAEKTPGPKPAPWAIAKEDKPRAGVASPSLRDIQEAEARRAEARKQALAEARAASASPAPTTAASAAGDDLPTSISWGLASQTKSASARSQSPAAASPVAPAWGGGGEAPKKTLKQIQEEEEKRKVRAAQAARAAQGLPAGAGAATAGAAQGGAGKRGYADLAATQAPPQAGWTTVGSGGRTASGTPAAVPARVATPVKPAAVPAKPVAAVAVPAAVKKANGSALMDDGAPSVEFVRWTKQALTGFKGDVDDFIQVLLSFPVDPPASARADQLEIISDSVYANSSTLDGRRFAQEFYTRRKADAARPASGAAGKQKIQSLADVVKTQPKQDTGFKVVKKGKKKA